MTTKATNKIRIQHFGDWCFDADTNTLTHVSASVTTRLEPKVSQLLHLLLEADGQLVSKEALLSKLWTNVVVGDDTLARTVSRLRNALSDSATDPNYIETIPKKGYRFKAKITTERKRKHDGYFPHVYIALTIFIVGTMTFFNFYFKENRELSEMLARADGLYMAFSEQSNEAALALYEAALEIAPDDARARAGIANAMVQRLVRWPSKAFSVDMSDVSLTKALASGQLSTSESKLMLERARLIAEKAVRLEPNNSEALKSLGFVYSAEGKIDEAIAQYQRAIRLNDNAWRSMINVGELYFLNGQQDKAIQSFIDAFEAMDAMYQANPQTIGPWQPEVGNYIAAHFLTVGELDNAQIWAQKVLQLVPFHRAASTVLVSTFQQREQTSKAKKVCSNYASKLPPLEVCQRLH